ncbi:hypothetical protein [Mesorhizobium sp.]|uniref:hypothetical protein n=1 Tax=Mesorhizobium sp. TaxID=1871066 RepID=UPI000FE6C113|nr:hypothetical protein [Mesorhizobium sp.]RWP35308.1 MAG: hypothetical protein EOR03_13085 [Mesorhizobium sp.]
MSYREALSDRSIGISVSETPDMPALGLSDEHLRDAMAEVSRHLLALGARLVYGGDLRPQGFTELLFELVARHRRDADESDLRTSVTNYLAWPVHIRMAWSDLEAYAAELAGSAALKLLRLDGAPLALTERTKLPEEQPSEAQWSRGLTALRTTMLAETHARIVLGGKVEGYNGAMPGVAEEALLSIRSGQPLFVLGGFGGCARDIAETIGLAPIWAASRQTWPGRDGFQGLTGTGLRNGLSSDENAILARTPHVDQAVALILRGLLKLGRTASA